MITLADQLDFNTLIQHIFIQVIDDSIIELVTLVCYWMI